MPVKNKFVPEKLSIIEFRILKTELHAPEQFNVTGVESFVIENKLELAFNLDEKLIKAEYSIEIKSKSDKENPEEATGNFLLVFIYMVENLNELAKADKNKNIILDSELANTIAAITYSTTRGVLLTRLQGTALQHFILPVINTNTLLQV
ncbi:MAG: hypothetical protein ACXWEY_05020 [Bacteroidia bacterium]